MLNRLWHVLIGIWVATGINRPDYRHGLYVSTASFLAYQALEAHRKGDKGYPEIKEFGIGLAIPFIYKRIQEVLEPETRRSLLRRVGRDWFHRGLAYLDKGEQAGSEVVIHAEGHTKTVDSHRCLIV